MGYDFTNDAADYARLSSSGWDLARAVARHYGWKPEGVPKPAHCNVPEYEDWGDGYWPNVGQRVSQADAFALANAIDAAVADLQFVPIARQLHAELIMAVDAQLPQSARASSAGA